MAKLEYSVVDGIFEQPSGKCFEVDTAAWWEWLESDEAKSFRFECDHGVESYTARKEVIQNKGSFWYAYKKLDKRLHKSYIGKSPELTLERLDTIADTLGKPKSPQLHTEELGNQDEKELHIEELGNQDEDEAEKLRARILELEQLNSELQAANQSLEKQLSECSLKNQSLQKAYDHEAEDAKRYYVLWRKYPDLERKNKRLQEQVDAFEAAPLKILDGWIEAANIDLKPRTADKLRAYREYLLRSSREDG